MKQVHNIYIVTAIVLPLFVLILILFAPKNPLTERNIGDPLDGYWSLGKQSGCYEKGPFSVIIKENFYTKLEPNTAPFLWGKIIGLEVSSDSQLFMRFKSLVNGSERKQTFDDYGNYLVSKSFSIKKKGKKDFVKKNNLNGKVFLTRCAPVNWYGKLMTTLRVWEYRKPRSDFLTYVD